MLIRTEPARWGTNSAENGSCVCARGDVGAGCWNYYMKLDAPLKNLADTCGVSPVLGINNQGNPSWSPGTYFTDVQVVGFNVII